MEKVNITFKSGATITVEGENYYHDIVCPPMQKDGTFPHFLEFPDFFVDTREIAAVLKLK